MADPAAPFSPPLFELLPMGVTFLDAAGAITATNPASEEILGLPAGSLVGRRFSDLGWRLLGEDGQPVTLDQLRQATPGRARPEGVKLGLLRPEGDPIWLELAAQHLPGGEVVVTYHDISYWRTMMEANLRMDSMLRTALELGRMGCFILREGGRDWVRNPALLEVIERGPEGAERFWAAVEAHRGGGPSPSSSKSPPWDPSRSASWPAAASRCPRGPAPPPSGSASCRTSPSSGGSTRWPGSGPSPRPRAAWRATWPTR